MRFLIQSAGLILCLLVSTKVALANDSWALEYNATCYTAPYDTYENFIESFVQRNNNPRYDRAYFESEFPEERFRKLRFELDCRWLIYRSGNAMVGGFAVFPREFDGEKLPVIIYNRAGHGPTNAVGFVDIFKNILPLAEAGYMVIGSQYRGGGGVFSGMSNGQDEYGGRDLNDVLRLIDVAQAIGPADESRVGLYGRARGSMMSFMAARERPTAFKALASAATLSDLEQWVAEWGESDHPASRYIPDYASRGQATLQERSVINWAEELPRTMPILLIHGQRDWNLTMDQSQKLAARLEAIGHPHELITYSHADHQFTNYRGDLSNALIEFFDTHLKP
ncbi:prolyl oligopeptidase family serine peptidase [Aliidiomarina halalkaliphila]|uniref:Prolyl oligopeptidase family serine peptidase n=1 Tax=Aliidiomarina halalkaliphila TaxID=2593535 RepID=A0A552X1R2_9GAMM|nr:prolyl oligopeptidase family serine peptidase [Aliidiomarina halalkaliphila]TRW48954.1 prolyl oligopeptidase family serine peptidase [Aliidiomarina halalkaliphila]